MLLVAMVSSKHSGWKSTPSNIALHLPFDKRSHDWYRIEGLVLGLAFSISNAHGIGCYSLLRRSRCFPW